MDHVIGVDIGTQSTKAVLVRQDGTIVAQASKSYAPETPRPSWAEQWPQVWLDAVVHCIATVMRDAGEPNSGTPLSPTQVKAVCISSLYGGSGIPVDADMKPLHPCLIWMDRRAEKQVAAGSRPMSTSNGSGPSPGTGSTAITASPRSCGCATTAPTSGSGRLIFCRPNAFVIHALTGAVAVDHSSAGNIGGVYDVERRSWSREMLDAMGVPPRFMPERLVACTDVVGGLRPERAAELGLPAGTPIVAGGVDAAVATYAAGVVGPGQHVAMIGTSMCWGYIAPTADAAHGLISMPYVTRPRDDLYVFGGASTAGACVTWYRDQFCQAEVEAGRAMGRDPHALLEEAATGIVPGADGIVFLPYLMGERSPVWDGQASGAFVGLSLFHTRAHLYRAVLEGVTLALRHNMEAGRRGAVSLDKRLVVVGGAAHSDLWMQIIADVTGYPVWTIKEDVEAALGAARLAALGVKLIEREGGDSWITLVQRAEPDPDRKSRYDALFAVYTGLYPALSGSMHALAALRGPIAAVDRVGTP